MDGLQLHPSQNQIILNPEDIQAKEHSSSCNNQQYRCRICYQNTNTLVSICSCTGSIRYVHEECILDWIAKKIQVSQVIDVPKCEICHEKFSAVIKIGKKKVCVQLLWEKIKQMRKWEIFISFVHVTVFLFCVFTILMAGSVLYSRLTFNNNINNNSEIKQQNSESKQRCQYWSMSDYISFIFTHFLCQIYGIFFFISYLKSKKAMIQQSVVQVVQVVLKPKIVKKN